MKTMLRERTKELLRKHELWLSKDRGQSHVVDEGLLKRMVSYANLFQDDVVLEIGPGIGNLTLLLVQEAGKVVAIESDEQLVEVLRQRTADRSNLEIIFGDVLEVELPRFDKVVSNLPFSISSEITFKLLDQDFELGVLMYQKEFAQRMIASPGLSDYSRLTVNVAYRADARILEKVPPSAFFPQPEVESAIVELRPCRPPFDVKDEKLFFRIVRAAFQHRRKKMRNALCYSFEAVFPDLKLSKSEKLAFIDKRLPKKLKNARVEELTPEELGELANMFS